MKAKEHFNIVGDFILSLRDCFERLFLNIVLIHNITILQDLKQQLLAT